MTHFATNLRSVQNRIGSALERFQRPPHCVQLLAVSKKFAADDVLQLYKAGQLDFGENYVQEALLKMNALSSYPLQWHFIGQLQSNKLKAIAQHFSWVHSLDSLAHAQKLSDYRGANLPLLNVCIQVKLDDNPRKGGVSPELLAELIKKVSQLSNIRVRGLMALPPLTDDFEGQRKYFSGVQSLFRASQAMFPQLDTLSMGTTGDLEAAIAEGSTLVRIGRGLFGSRT